MPWAPGLAVPLTASRPPSPPLPAGVLGSKGDKAHPKRPWGRPRQRRRPPCGPFPLLSRLLSHQHKVGITGPAQERTQESPPAGAQPAGAQGGVTWPGGRGRGTRGGWSPVTPMLWQAPRAVWIRRVPLAPAPLHGGERRWPEDGEGRSLSPGKGHQTAASTGEIAEVARATGQGPGGRTSEEPAGAAGKSYDPASGGHVQNNRPAALRGRGRAHVGLAALGAATLGAEGHGYFWVSLAAGQSLPTP